ncbi:hypothetical protein [Actinocrispum wychmicini]|uniref:Uncharacterized protein n=1 Tax=Actinocrispum wychmicini TaxID=1213861 RepID=A0A4R2JKC6_9PSEU|nr:hypothetical protein [Actinocrispum wychmicini]TCO59604.1 hypothetical protein EV192_104447 [Actinocrispum wychmicini]
MPVDVPYSLRVMARERRGAWQLRLTPGNVPAVLAPLVWVLMMMTNVFVGTAAVAAALLPFAGLYWDLHAPSAPPVLSEVALLPAVLLPCWLVSALVACLAKAMVLFTVGFRQIELWPLAAPTRVVVTGWVRRVVIDSADLTSVLVRHRTGFWAESWDLVLRAGTVTVVCRPTIIFTVLGPRRHVEAEVLADWLREVLGPAEVIVRHYDPGSGSRRFGATWVSANTAATILGIPKYKVPALADSDGVYAITRKGTRVFNRYDIEDCASRARAIEQG